MIQAFSKEGPIKTGKTNMLNGNNKKEGKRKAKT